VSGDEFTPTGDAAPSIDHDEENQWVADSITLVVATTIARDTHWLHHRYAHSELSS